MNRQFDFSTLNNFAFNQRELFKIDTNKLAFARKKVDTPVEQWAKPKVGVNWIRLEISPCPKDTNFAVDGAEFVPIECIYNNNNLVLIPNGERDSNGEEDFDFGLPSYPKSKSNQSPIYVSDVLYISTLSQQAKQICKALGTNSTIFLFGPDGHAYKVNNATVKGFFSQKREGEGTKKRQAQIDNMLAYTQEQEQEAATKKQQRLAKIKQEQFGEEEGLIYLFFFLSFRFLLNQNKKKERVSSEGVESNQVQEGFFSP
jgi:hypothetical protein